MNNDDDKTVTVQVNNASNSPYATNSNQPEEVRLGSSPQQRGHVGMNHQASPGYMPRATYNPNINNNMNDAITDMDDGPTVKAKRFASADDDERTILRPKAKAGSTNTDSEPEDKKDDNYQTDDYTTGWIVAISGPAKGKSYALRFGRNHIGRAEQGNYIRIQGDRSISGQAIIITYERRSNKFRVSCHPSAQQEAYVNDHCLDSSITLNNADKIHISPDTTLRFIRFCDEEFIWEE